MRFHVAPLHPRSPTTTADAATPRRRARSSDSRPATCSTSTPSRNHRRLALQARRRQPRLGLLYHADQSSQPHHRRTRHRSSRPNFRLLQRDVAAPKTHGQHQRAPATRASCCTPTGPSCCGPDARTARSTASTGRPRSPPSPSSLPRIRVYVVGVPGAGPAARCSIR
jgi:hypothetical protein